MSFIGRTLSFTPCLSYLALCLKTTFTPLMKLLHIVAPLLLMTLSISVIAQSGWQEDWNHLKNGGVINIPEGTFHLSESLTLEGKKDVQIKGAGMGKTILVFNGKNSGRAAIRITNSENIRLDGFTVVDPAGDGFYADAVRNVQFLFLEVRWNVAGASHGNGSGIHSDRSQRVLFFECKATGAPKAGLQTTQCEQVVMRKCTVSENLIGIFSINTSYVDLVENTVSDNTTGIIMHDSPDLKGERSWDVEVYKNTIRTNNRDVSAMHDTLLAIPGSGIILLGVSDVNVFENTIDRNRTGNLLILSFPVVGSTLTTRRYDPQRIYIRQNTFLHEKSKPMVSTEFGKVIRQKFGKNIPDIIYDGIQDEINISPTTGRLLPEYQICIYDNAEATFGNLDAGHDYKGVTRDLTLFQCK
jgi:parallel beta-helix repeat protein